jgi:dihydroorotate dehydrogenase (NAD+) catalytic subunit
MLNSIGIENPGLQGYLEQKVPILRELPCAAIVSVEGEDVGEFCELVRGVDGSGAAHAIEVNISCPNVGPHGLRYSTDAGMAREVMNAIRPLTSSRSSRSSPQRHPHRRDRPGVRGPARTRSRS